DEPVDGRRQVGQGGAGRREVAGVAQHLQALGRTAGFGGAQAAQGALEGVGDKAQAGGVALLDRRAHQRQLRRDPREEELDEFVHQRRVAIGQVGKGCCVEDRCVEDSRVGGGVGCGGIGRAVAGRLGGGGETVHHVEKL